MTDRELLEAAAKAAGIVGQYVEDHDGGYYYEGLTEGILIVHADGRTQVWNPLDDDGDALRMAVTCFASMHWSVSFSEVVVAADSKGIACEVAVPHDFSGPGGISAATRRAIVRAAAAIVSAPPPRVLAPDSKPTALQPLPEPPKRLL